MSDLKEKIESIIITEVNKLYEKAAGPGLTVEDIRKLEVLVKIKDIENIPGIKENEEKRFGQNKLSKDEAAALVKKLRDGQKHDPN